jgi:DNA primase small subunit
MSKVPDRFLRQYYTLIFPYDLYYRWLSYGNVDKSRFPNREFAYGLPGDVFVRYRCFADAKEMKDDLIATCPERIDIGPVYHAPPKQHSTTVMVPREKE